METIDIELSDETFFRIAIIAHEKDITFNQMVTEMLREYIETLTEKETNE